MKLLNRTRIPDAPMRRLLTRAGRSVGALTKDAIIQVNPGRSWRCSGSAYPSGYFSWADRHNKRRRFFAWGGGFQIVLPTENMRSWRLNAFGNYIGPGALEYTERFFQVAQHEWSHLLDFQTDRCFRRPHSRRSIGGRRARWGTRPEELRAINAVDASKGVQHYGRIILDFAVVLAEIYPDIERIPT